MRIDEFEDNLVVRLENLKAEVLHNGKSNHRMLTTLCTGERSRGSEMAHMGDQLGTEIASFAACLAKLATSVQQFVNSNEPKKDQIANLAIASEMTQDIILHTLPPSSSKKRSAQESVELNTPPAKLRKHKPTYQHTPDLSKATQTNRKLQNRSTGTDMEIDVVEVEKETHGGSIWSALGHGVVGFMLGGVATFGALIAASEL